MPAHDSFLFNIFRAKRTSFQFSPFDLGRLHSLLLVFGILRIAWNDGGDEDSKGPKNETQYESAGSIISLAAGYSGRNDTAEENA